MEQITKQTFFALLRSAICGTKLTEDERNVISNELFSDLLKLSTRHDVAHIVASVLLQEELLGEDEASRTFKNILMKAVYRDVQKEFAITQMTSLLGNANIPHILLKGSLVRKFYPQTWMRTSCDIDVLVQKKDIELAIDRMCNAGYKRMEGDSTHDYSFVSPNKVHIELHYTLTQEGQFAASNKILDSVWESYTELVEGYNYRYCMTTEMFILYHLAHMARHLVYGGCGVRPFIDLWLINKHMVIDTEKLYSLLDQANLLQFYQASGELSVVWLENNQHNVKTKHLEEFILSGGVYGTTSNAAKVKAAKGISKVRSFLNVMFLPKENLQVLYPNLRKHPILYPFYQIKRWFRIFYKEKRNKIIHLTEQRNKVTNDEMDEIAYLLNQLGLN